MKNHAFASLQLLFATTIIIAERKSTTAEIPSWMEAYSPGYPQEKQFVVQR